MIINNDTRNLKIKKEEALRRLKESRNIEEKIALVNYIGNITSAIASVEGTKFEFNRKRVFGSFKHKKFLRKIDIYQDQILDEFVLKKSFHENFLGETLSGVEDNFQKIEETDISPTTTLSENDFNTIFYDFMNSIGLADIFMEFMKKEYIHSTFDSADERLGFTTYNPIDKQLDIFITDFNYDIHSMTTLAHEFGHVYDFMNFEDDILTYNRYFYKSFFVEVLSKTFEKLFLDYMIENNVLYSESQDKLFEYAVVGHDFILSSYMLSLLPDKFLTKNVYSNLSKERLLSIIKDSFIDEEAIKEFVYNARTFDLSEELSYAYGDILSLFLRENIKNEGLNNKFMKEFFKNRTEVFSEKFFEDNGFDSKSYVKLHDKYLETLKN